jgi:hypothetical protein
MTTLWLVMESGMYLWLQHSISCQINIFGDSQIVHFPLPMEEKFR